MTQPSFAEYCYNETVGKGVDPKTLDLDVAHEAYKLQYPELKTCVYVDDLRLPIQRLEGYADWVVCRSWAEWVEYLSMRGVPDHVSFDHDLAQEHLDDFRKYEFEGIAAINYGDFKQWTGLGCAQYYCEFCELHNLEMKGVAAHCTERPLGARNIRETLNAYKASKGLLPDCFLAAIPSTTLEAIRQTALERKLQM